MGKFDWYLETDKNVAVFISNLILHRKEVKRLKIEGFFTVEISWPAVVKMLQILAGLMTLAKLLGYF